MKNQTLNIVASLLIMLSSTACKKDSTGGPTGQEILTMKVDGVDWVGDDDLAGFKFKTNNKANISGRQISTDESLVISNIEVLTTGSYTINPVLFQNISFLKDGASPKIYQVRTSIPQSRATLIVNKINAGDNLIADIEGTFSGVLFYSATDSVVITNGVFTFN